MVIRSRIGSLGTALLAVALVALYAAIMWRIPALTARAAAPLLLLAVLLVARSWGTQPALASAAYASFAFIYYFLPAEGLFIYNVDDWVASLTFTATAIVVGELAGRAERRQLEAEEGRREIEQLYRQLGEAFERASEAEAARRNEQLKAALLDALTHNLRTPLTAIKAAVTAMLGYGGRTSPAELSKEGHRELLQVIDEESDRLNRFIEGLSSAERPDSAAPPKLRPAPLDAIVREALARGESVLRRHRVQVALEPGLPEPVVEPAAIAEALYMLLDNASKYSPAGTTIRVAAATEDDHHIRLSVSDEGPGIPAELREQVFEKFFRIPGREPFDARRGGIGLGLPIARRLAVSQAGGLWIETPPSGRGTVVVLKLPTGGVLGAAAGEHPEIVRV